MKQAAVAASSTAPEAMLIFPLIRLLSLAVMFLSPVKTRVPALMFQTPLAVCAPSRVTGSGACLGERGGAGEAGIPDFIGVFRIGGVQNQPGIGKSGGTSVVPGSRAVRVREPPFSVMAAPL